MTEFTDKKPGEKIFQLSGVFCFYSKQRGPEYNTTAFKLGESETEPVTVNYFGSMLSDGTPGGMAGDVIVRPDSPDSYVLAGKVIPNTGNQTFLMPIDLKQEVAMQSGEPYEAPAPVAPAAEAATPHTQQSSDKKELEKAQRAAYDRKVHTMFKMNMGKK